MSAPRRARFDFAMRRSSQGAADAQVAVAMTVSFVRVRHSDQISTGRPKMDTLFNSSHYRCSGLPGQEIVSKSWSRRHNGSENDPANRRTPSNARDRSTGIHKMGVNRRPLNVIAFMLPERDFGSLLDFQLCPQVASVFSSSFSPLPKLLRLSPQIVAGFVTKIAFVSIRGMSPRHLTTNRRGFPRKMKASGWLFRENAPPSVRSDANKRNLPDQFEENIDKMGLRVRLERSIDVWS